MCSFVANSETVTLPLELVMLDYPEPSTESEWDRVRTVCISCSDGQQGIGMVDGRSLEWRSFERWSAIHCRQQNSRVNSTCERFTRAIG